MNVGANLCVCPNAIVPVENGIVRQGNDIVSLRNGYVRPGNGIVRLRNGKKAKEMDL